MFIYMKAVFHSLTNIALHTCTWKLPHISISSSFYSEVSCQRGYPFIHLFFERLQRARHWCVLGDMVSQPLS